MTTQGQKPGLLPFHYDPPRETHYQLAHNYLILPIRQWIDRKQRSTRTGRARRRLQAITAAWLERPGARQLPSVLEYAGILRNTRPGDWSSEERRLMRAATFHLLRRLAVAAALLAAIVIGGKVLIDQQDARTQLNMAFWRERTAISQRLSTGSFPTSTAWSRISRPGKPLHGSRTTNAKCPGFCCTGLRRLRNAGITSTACCWKPRHRAG